MPENILDRLQLRALSPDDVDLSNLEITNLDFVSDIAADFTAPAAFGPDDLLTPDQLAQLLLRQLIAGGHGALGHMAPLDLNRLATNLNGAHAGQAAGAGPVSQPASSPPAEFKVGSDPPPNPYAAEIAQYSALFNSEPTTFWDRNWISWFAAKARIEAVGGALVYGYNHASDNLLHFLDNTGDPFDVHTDEFIRQDSNAKKRFYEDLSAAMDFVESANRTHNPLGGNIVQANNSILLAPESTVDWDGAAGQTSWYVRGQNIKIIGNECSMDFSVHQRDFYKWDPQSTRSFAGLKFSDLAKLHEFGVAQDFVQFGSFTTTVTWRKGQRPGSGATLADAP
jgi:hypothetical protein